MAGVAIAKRMVPSDSACQIGLSTLSRKALTVDQGAYRWSFKNRNFGDVFAFALRTGGRTGKWMVPSDSACQIGISILSRKALTVDQGACRWCSKIAKSGMFLLPLWEPVEIQG